MQVSDNINDYCDPSKVQTLPFPFLGRAPARFKLENGYFQFYGRRRFRELYKEADSMMVPHKWQCDLEGTMGAGKSHTLASIICLMIRRGKAVVYLPDCRSMLARPSVYLQNALLLTFFRDKYFHEDILSLALEDNLTDPERWNRLKQICNSAAKVHLFLLFTIDRVNALDEVVDGQDRFSNELKAGVWALLDEITALHMRFVSSTANWGLK